MASTITDHFRLPGGFNNKASIPYDRFVFIYENFSSIDFPSDMDKNGIIELSRKGIPCRVCYEPPSGGTVRFQFRMPAELTIRWMVAFAKSICREKSQKNQLRCEENDFVYATSKVFIELFRPEFSENFDSAFHTALQHEQMEYEQKSALEADLQTRERLDPPTPTVPRWTSE